MPDDVLIGLDRTLRLIVREIVSCQFVSQFSVLRLRLEGRLERLMVVAEGVPAEIASAAEGVCVRANCRRYRDYPPESFALDRLGNAI